MFIKLTVNRPYAYTYQYLIVTAYNTKKKKKQLLIKTIILIVFIKI